MLDVREICTFASYFVICSGESERQLAAIGDEIAHVLKKAGELPIHQEGDADSGWMLYDYGDVVVHVFSTKEREFYRFDDLWNKAVPVLTIQ